MRTIVTSIMLAFWSILTFAQEPVQDVTSKIAKVTVFLEGAQIVSFSKC